MPRLAKKRVDGGRDLVTALVTEEKGSDVNLASHLVWDAAHHRMTEALVISNDSDLQTPITMACDLGVEVLVANPHWHSGQAHHLYGSGRRQIRRGHLARNQLPDRVVDPAGHVIIRPGTWLV